MNSLKDLCSTESPIVRRSEKGRGGKIELSGHGSRKWRVGLVNCQGKYLTAESFGFKINASGISLKKKQKWTIEQDPLQGDDKGSTVYICSHLGRYMAGDKRGNASCSSEEKGEAERFLLHYNPDGSGRWGIQNRKTGYYLGGNEDKLRIYEKQPRATEWWTVHLDIHPQVTLRNPNRQRYATMDPINECLGFTGVTAWGKNALVTLEYDVDEGKYVLKTCDNRFLHRDGTLTDQKSVDTTYALELKSGQCCGVALRDCTGKYLSAVGKDGVMKGKNKTVGKDELFVIEDSQPQVFFVAHNEKIVTTRQGIDITANYDDDLTDKEIFQIEFETEVENIWRIRTSDNKYWIQESSGGIKSIGDEKSTMGLFFAEWLANGSICLKANNDRYVTTRLNSSLFAGSETAGEKEEFRVTLVNRPILILKCEHGFVGFRSWNCPRYECNKTTYDPIQVEYDLENAGVYFLKGHNDKYWSVDSEGHVSADQSKEPHLPFLIELRSPSKIGIRTATGHYIRGEQNGNMSVKNNDLQKATQWEY